MILLLAALLGFAPGSALAVVGQAEKYDEFKWEDLKDHYDEMVHEGRKEKLERSSDISKVVKRKQADIAKAKGEEKDALLAEMAMLKKELLQLPKRDRFKVEMKGTYKYDNNASRARIRSEKPDAMLETEDTAVFDLSGRKTDLRFETTAARQWSLHYPEKDAWLAESRLRYRRKYFKKLTQSQQMKVTRHSSKTVEINTDKIRWDLANTSSMNLAFSPKLSLNNEISNTKRVFPQEAFDNDSTWDAGVSPSAFWNFTPKTRISTGYSIANNTIRSKAGNAVSHGFRVGYFGKVTKKSSTSLDISYVRQIPKSMETPKSAMITTGLGYIWQMTRKSQMTVQLIRSLQNTTSNLVSGDPNTDGVSSKIDSYFTNDSLSLSLNSRLTRKLMSVIVLNATQVRTRTEAGGDKDTETRQITFPLSITLSYIFTRWLNMTLNYTFSYRTGDEKKADENRGHSVMALMNVSM